MKFQENFCILLLLATADAGYKEQHIPCSFNPLCTCTNAVQDLGYVSCHDIPFITLPSQIKNSAIYKMSLKHNQLRFLEDYRLNGTGLHTLKINNNLLTDLPPNALAGLDKTLAVLDLSENELFRIPKEAIQSLEKLTHLLLAGNHINFVQSDDFRSVCKTLRTLDLSDNSITHITTDAFRNMEQLETLNLNFNAIISIDDIFQGNLKENLRNINLMGNQIRQIPLNALSNMKKLKTVNLNDNLISFISDGRKTTNRINLEELHLENNLIQELTPESFRSFNEIDRLYLKGNPLTIINDTFLAINVSEIYFQNCQIALITANAFHSATQYLKVLDLSYNNLQEFPTLPLKKLIKLSVAGNEISFIEPDKTQQFENTLKYLDVRGTKIRISQDIFKNLPNLRELLLSKQQSNINVQTLLNVSPSLEKLSIVKSSIKKIESGIFSQLAGLKYLDLSYNSIVKLADTTFKEIGHTLERIILHKALNMPVFPAKTLNHLSVLKYLDASANQIDHIPPDSFSTHQSLKYLNLNHNNLQNFDINFINGINNPVLTQLKLAFNKLAALKSHTFRDLQHLIYLQLNDNLIKTIEKSAFANLDSLISIDLEGNQIEEIEDEAFQNLPNIQYINLAYNNLTTLNLEAFDQVGRLSNLKIDADHNNIQNLTRNYTASHSSTSIKCFNLSYNNISFLDSNYFQPIRLSINTLDLSHNYILNLTNMAFSGMAHLQILVLSNNLIHAVEVNELYGIMNLQILDLSNNQVQDLPDGLFEEQDKLRIILLANNQLNFLPNDIFSDTVLEQLDLSFNNFEEFPEDSLLQIKNTIQYLDLAGNEIQFLNFSNINHLQNLRHFSISQNKLHLLDAVGSLELPKLISLDLSHNEIQDLPQWITENLPSHIEFLNLANTSLKTVPDLNTLNILLLNLSTNAIQTIQSEALEQLKKIQILDISNNQLPSIYNNLWSSFQHLRSLYLQTNPINSISNTSFNNMERLQELFIKDLKLQDIQKEAFHQLTALKKIEMDTYPKIKNINLSQLLSKNYGLKEVHLHIQENDLERVLNGPTPKSLKAIILEGKNLETVADSAFDDIQSQDITLDIRNTNLTSLSQNLFQNMKEVKNLTASFKNNKLQKVERVITAFEKEGMHKNLKLLELSGNQLHCNCEHAWIWEWLSEYEFYNECNEVPCDDSYLQDLREVKCINLQNKSIISAFKTDLDCFTSGTSSIYNSFLQLFIVTAFSAICVKFI